MNTVPREAKRDAKPPLQLRGDDPLFESFTGRSLVGRDLVHLDYRAELTGLCGADLFKSWERHASAMPFRRFKVCAACVAAAREISVPT